MTLALIRAAAMCPGARFGQVERVANATILAEHGRILSITTGGQPPPGATVLDAAGRLVTPGLVDCHTHAWFLGSRAEEFALRNAGVGYLEIARRGGGIQSTVQATRAGTSDERLRLLKERLRRLARQGITTVEVKSGYGLSYETELAALEEIGSFQDADLPAVTPTLLAAHAFPPEAGSPEERQAWVETIATRLIPEVARRRLAQRMDIFVESGAYSAADAERLTSVARSHGLACHLHVDQLTEGHGAQLAARLEAQAAAHLECVSDEGIRALAEAGVVAVLIPTATVAAGVDRFARARKMVDAGVPIALSTNLNPGTAPTESTSLMFFLAATGLHLTPDEILWAATRGGAMALGRSDVGRIEPGTAADLVIWNAAELAHLPYHAGVNHVRQVVRAGRVIVDRSQAADDDCPAAPAEGT